ncbi:MAG TPA: TonB-dependent receptor [Terracidiphilus sp.]|nr:TonB-dependent receptor [Terracidiphilus sp.]
MRSLSFGIILFAFLAFAAMRGAQGPPAGQVVLLAVVDENGQAVADAQVFVTEEGRAGVRLSTDYLGHAMIRLHSAEPYHLRVEKPGFYQTVQNETDRASHDIRVVLRREQMVLEQVQVSASVPGIDPEQTSDVRALDVPEIINVPYPTSRDIRNLLQFYPGVVADETGQVHVAGSETWATLDTLDRFDIRSPVSGILAMRVSADAVRSIDQETTRYPVEYGRATGGVIAFSTGMGDNKLRFNATDFLPSFQDINGIRFDKFVPRFTLSGPMIKNEAWFFDGLEVEYDNIYIKELPSNADTNHLIRGSNLIKFQANPTPSNILSAGLLLNEYHSPYDGISSLVPQPSTTKRNTIAWLPYARDQISFHHGALLDLGIGVVRFRDGYEPHPDGPFQITPETFLGSYFENLVSRSQRVEGNAALYWPTRYWLGSHNLKAGVDVDRIGFDENVSRAPVSYLREDKTVERQSVFPAAAPFTRHNAELGAYLEDRWTPRTGWLFEPGLRFDWDEVVRRPLVSPRLAAVYSPGLARNNTKISAGIGLYYEHTQLEYLERSLAGVRSDTYYAADGVTPTGPALQTTFAANEGSLREAHAVNWSIGIEQKLPGSTYLSASLIRKIVSNEFTYANQSGPAALSGTYLLTNQRQDHDSLEEIDLRHTFHDNYTLFGAYTHSSAHTNAAIDYIPTLSYLGPQQSGPLPWDTPNRVISWGWLPFLVPGFKKSWDYVYTLDWHTGFPFTSINDNYQVVGAAGSRRFPNDLTFSPGLEWRFHFRGSYFGLRGVIENITDSGNYLVVNNVVDSSQYGMFTEPVGRALTARLRLIGSRK